MLVTMGAKKNKKKTHKTLGHIKAKGKLYMFTSQKYLLVFISKRLNT